MTKRNILLVSIIGVVLYLVSMYSVSFGICDDASYSCRKTADLAQTTFTIFPLVLLFSLITYKMQEVVFQAWWRFAMWFVPLIMIVTFFLYSGHQQSGFGGVAQDAFYFAILVALYAIFILTSLIRIVLAHRRLKQENM